MPHAVSWRPLTAEAKFRPQANPCGIFGGQNGYCTGFSPNRLSLLHQCSISATDHRLYTLLAIDSDVKQPTW